MKNIVIAGAGPIGLYIAIEMAKRIPPNLGITITVVDTRLGTHTRPGIIASNAFVAVSQNNPKLDVPKIVDNSNAINIADLQDSLYEEAKKYKKIIKFKKSSFANIEDGQVEITSKHSKTIEKLDCDLLIDCTGAQRAVVTKLNETLPNPPFKITEIDDNPIKHHFIAYVTIDVHNEQKTIKDRQINPISYALKLEKLRELGWPEFSEPDIDMKRKKTVGGQDTLHYYYFEIPEALFEAGPDKQKEWLKTLLELKTGAEDIQFEVVSEDPSDRKFVPFILNPHKVEQPLFEFGNEYKKSIVIPCGDAYIEPDYRIGIGITSGVSRANNLISSLFLSQNSLEINIQGYNEAIVNNQLLNWQIGQFKSGCKSVKKSLSTTRLDDSEKYYDEALRSIKNDPNTQSTIESGLQELQAIKELSRNIEKIKSFQANDEANLEIYQDALTNFFVKIRPDRRLPNHTIKLIIDIAEQEKLCGNSLLIQKKKPQEAMIHYQKALEIYQRIDNKPPLNVMAVYSNLVKASAEAGSATEAIRYSNDALRFIKKHHTKFNSSREAELSGKIELNMCRAMIQLAGDFITKCEGITDNVILLSQVINNIETACAFYDEKILSRIGTDKAYNLLPEQIEHLHQEALKFKTILYKAELEQIKNTTIKANITVLFGTGLFISGSSPSLGSWEEATRMKYKDDHWEFTGNIPPGTEFKLLIGTYDGNEKRPVSDLTWQTGPNSITDGNNTITSADFENDKQHMYS